MALPEVLEDRRLLSVSVLNQFWQPVETIPASDSGRPSHIAAAEFEAFSLAADSFRSLLDAAPLEFTQAAPTEIRLPDPDGKMARFNIVESPIMAPELAKKFPQIKTYSGQGLDDPAATLRFDVTPAGFHAQVLSPRGAYYIDPYYHLDDSLYASYYAGNDLIGPAFQEFQWPEPEPATEPFKDGSASGKTAVGKASESAASGINKANAAPARSGTQLRTYRTAVAATGEYTAFHGGTVAAGQAAIVTAINRVTGIYEQELTVRLQLVANNNLLVYTDAASDPYTNNDAGALLSENQTNLDNLIGDANYDIGHVFTTGGGGLAGLGVVGISGSKARGETGLSNPTGDAFFVDFVAHEMGHQFAANHSFNGDSGSCASGNRNASTAYEPGSGSTVAAYAGICGDDNLQSNSDPYFHSISFDEIISFVDSSIPAVGTRTATGNTVPVVNAGNNFTIPAATGFTLTATGSDGDAADVLTYSWEQRDLGPQQDVNAGDNGSSPLFRSFLPTTDASRTFPRLSDLLNNTTVIGETLPTTNRALNFRATVRDNRSGGGGVNTDDMVVNVVNTGSPFQVTSPNSALSWPAQSTQTVAWNVAGTTANGIDTALVNILLSTDGGNTFSTVLAANTPNDGAQDIVLPATATTTARIKVEAVGNIFFDLSNANFTISPAVFSEDFGDAPDDPYATLRANNGARHTAGGPFLGNSVDTEGDGQPNTTASGDGSDEDGIELLAPLIAGTTVNLQVTSPLNGGKLDYFFDFDATGGFGNNANEVFGTTLSGGTELVPVIIPAGTSGSVFARFRISSAGGLGSSGAAADGEVEDYLMNVFTTAPPIDFGDAPDAAYPTVLTDNGPRHIIAGPRLGATVDGELDGLPNATATGDGRDDDGVTFQNVLLRGSTTNVSVTSSAGGGVLDYFFDFDGDGTFGNSVNEVFRATLSGGTEQLPVAIPANAALGTTYARFRISSGIGLSSAGFAQDGEVEDYQVVVVAPLETCGNLEHFDGVTTPNLPAGWTTASTASSAFRTVAGSSDTAPNHAFVPNIDSVSDNLLTSPVLAITADNARLRFRNSYSMEPGFDGGVLEISIGGGPFTDFVASGGSFVTGGYTAVISSDFENPLAGRQAWSNNSSGFIDTVANLPAAAIGQNVSFRWRQGTDSSVSDVGWRIDTIQLCGDGIGPLDYGDAPDPSYPTLASNRGAAHVAGALFLGAGVDIDADGQPDASALGDDADGNGDDEDGVALPPFLTLGTTASLPVTASATGVVNAWIDLNDDGDWSDPGEQVIKDTAVAAGVNNLDFDVPSSATATSDTFVRFRVSNQAGLSFDGEAPEGEVEDYAVGILSGSTTPTVTLAVNDASIGENGGVATFTAILSAASQSAVTVALGFTGSATLAADYTPSGTEIVIAAGNTRGTIIVTAVSDSLAENDETVIVDITGVTNGTESGTQQQTTTITDDDTPSVTLSVNDADIGENGGVATFAATLSMAAGLPVTVALGFTGTATPSDDYTHSGSQIVIPTGSTSGSITVTALQDGLDESNETIVVDISGVTNAIESGVQQQTTTIIDGDKVAVPAPKVTNQIINGAGNNNRSAIATLAVQFDRAVTVNGVTSLRLFNHTTGLPLEISTATLQNNGTSGVTWNFAGINFPNGYYSAELLNTDAVSAGKPLAATHSFLFHVLAGDSSGNVQVDSADFNDFANHFNTINGPVLGPGDLDGNGNVDFSDFGILANNFNTILTALTMDFGDAPESGTSFPTTLANNGARHILGSGVFLGSEVDSEANGQPDVGAAGDGSDEDGVTFGALQAGTTASVSVTATVPGTAVLNAWVDFNADGDWDDSGEQIFVDQALSSGTNNLTAAIPSGATTGQVLARFRITSSAGYAYFGLAPDGEVEDYQVNILASRSRPSLPAQTDLAELWASQFVDQLTDVQGPGPRGFGLPPRGSGEPSAEVVDRAITELVTREPRPQNTSHGHALSGERAADQVSADETDELLRDDLLGVWLPR